MQVAGLSVKQDLFIEWMTNGQAMVLRINILWYSGFILRQQLPFLWEETGSLSLALVGLTVGRHAGRWNVA